MKAFGHLLLVGSWNPGEVYEYGDPQYGDPIAREKHLVGGTPRVFSGQHVGAFSPSFILTNIEYLLSARRSVGAGWVETAVWGLLGPFIRTLWAPVVLAREVGLLWECILATVTPLFCVLGALCPQDVCILTLWAHRWVDWPGHRPRT